MAGDPLMTALARAVLEQYIRLTALQRTLRKAKGFNEGHLRDELARAARECAVDFEALDRGEVTRALEVLTRWPPID